MERYRKQIKKGGFETLEESGKYVDVLFEQNPKLTSNLWAKILAQNEKLSLKDIKKMCAARPDTFGKLCETGIIWTEIFIRQFGREEYNRVFDLLSPLARENIHQGDFRATILLSWRIWNRLKRQLFIVLEKDDESQVELVYKKRTKNIEFENDSEDENMLKVTKKEDIFFFGTILIERKGVKQKRLDKLQNVFGETNPKHSWAPVYGPRGGQKGYEDRYSWKMESTIPLEIQALMIIYIFVRQGFSTPNKTEHIDRSLCFVCSSIATNTCGQCLITPYCSQECANQDWRNHKCL